MMTQAGFVTAGYVIFWNFNRIELLSAALVLTGVLVMGRRQIAANNWHRIAIVLSVLLLAVSLFDTYFLTPQMCAAGLQLNLFDLSASIPATMSQMHVGYWVLEAVKLITGGTLLSHFLLNAE
jgi:general stress protein CsbA